MPTREDVVTARGLLFLEELAKLTLKYKMYIDGCGCCGSPFIESFEGDYVLDDLTWDKDEQVYR